MTARETYLILCIEIVQEWINLIRRIMDHSVIILNQYRVGWCPFLVIVQILMLLLAANELLTRASRSSFLRAL